MNSSGLNFELYRSRHCEEWLTRIGPADGIPILFVPPLFEEMNRTRALLTGIMRRLAARSYGCWLPDLSGTGESEKDLSTIEWEDWRHDVTAAADHVRTRSNRPLWVASLRGGSLIDDAATAEGWWRFAPVEGASLARDMKRSGLAGAEWAGYSPGEPMKSALETAMPNAVTPLRVVQLQSHRAEADSKLPGPALWRRSEPAMSDELADAICIDLDNWIRSCAAC